jgi:hypothetical protein
VVQSLTDSGQSQLASLASTSSKAGEDMAASQDSSHSSNAALSQNTRMATEQGEQDSDNDISDFDDDDVW